MLWLGVILIVVGIALLWVVADPFVEAAARLASIWGVSPVLVGALVIGFGTSAPELTPNTSDRFWEFRCAVGMTSPAKAIGRWAGRQAGSVR